MTATRTWRSDLPAVDASLGGRAPGRSDAAMPGVNRQPVDLSGFPDLVVIYLGMRVKRPRGLRTLAWVGPEIKRSVAERPDGLLLREDIIYSLFPPHLGMRQYWRDFDAMERWARSLPHKQWWQRFARDSGGTGFWHETYLMRGGMEAIFDDIDRPLGLMQVAPRHCTRTESLLVSDGSMTAVRRSR
jgi:Domain of unknown function (DUF4188)